MGAKLLTHRTFRVETVEDRCELLVRNSRPLVLDGDQDGPPIVACGEADLAKRRAERHGVGNKVAKHLRQASLDPGYDEWPGAAGQIEYEVRRALCPGRLVKVGECLQHRRDVDWL